MNERGLFLDLDRIARGRPIAKDWWKQHRFETPTTHRMHVVCGTLESLGYLERRIPWIGLPGEYSAWQFTEAGAELLEELTWQWSIR